MMPRLLVLLMVIALVPAWTLNSASAAPQSRAELKERFAQRYPDLNRLKNQGKIGENLQGFVEAVKDESDLDREARELMKVENADRRKLYDLISENIRKDGRDVSPEKVAERNARRNFMNAKPSEFLKSKDGKWVQRRDVNELKRKGQIGETWEGYVLAVEGAALNAKAEAVIEVENIARREEYYRQAKDDDSGVERVAEAAGKKNIDNARSGEYIKRKNGEWERKN